jgi:hypothetical protein
MGGGIEEGMVDGLFDFVDAAAGTDLSAMISRFLVRGIVLITTPISS